MREVIRRCRAGTALLALLAVGCMGLDRRAETSEGFAEPEVFEIVRAGNSRAVLDYLNQRYEEEVQHARILQESIAELIAAEEGLAQRMRLERNSFESLQADLEALVQRRDETALKLREAHQQQTELDQQLVEAEQLLGAAREKLDADPPPDPALLEELRAVLQKIDS